MSFQARAIAHGDKPGFYRELIEQATALLAGERDAIANAANVSALLYHSMPDVNWAGFYFLRADDELVLGPFQGKPACVRIARGRGVCGAAVVRGSSVLVPDVNAFPGHIACDSASQSELVIPLKKEGRILGVLDIDSPITNRFDAEDQAGLERIAAIFVAGSDPA
ncbi:MAG: GAF domain-containing protein [Candidatus Binataceae bacterium]